MAILITGAAGYIGSHTSIECNQSYYETILIDNFENSSHNVISRIEKILGHKTTFYKGDIRDEVFLEDIFAKHKVHAVIHFAGLKIVGDSLQNPLDYYHTNLSGTLNLLKVMKKANVFHFVFSSSATVYGEPTKNPLKETDPLFESSNPYGKSKRMIEVFLEDLCFSDARWAIANLRYFNPIGAHKSGLIGDDPRGIPTNIMPFISQVAIGKLKKLYIYGNDYPTVDGTGVRDYIHVLDLAKGHLFALKHLEAHKGFHIYNLGTGRGHSILELLKTFEAVTGKKVPFEYAPRRKGDFGEVWSSVQKAKKELSWAAIYGLEEMVQDTWRWQKKNPNGYSQ